MLSVYILIRSLICKAISKMRFRIAVVIFFFSDWKPFSFSVYTQYDSPLYHGNKQQKASAHISRSNFFFIIKCPSWNASQAFYFTVAPMWPLARWKSPAHFFYLSRSFLSRPHSYTLLFTHKWCYSICLQTMWPWTETYIVTPGYVQAALFYSQLFIKFYLPLYLDKVASRM